MDLIDIWNCRVPLKIQIFLWMVYHDRIQSVVQLKKRRWAGEVNCKNVWRDRNCRPHLIPVPDGEVFVDIPRKLAKSQLFSYLSRRAIL